MMHCQRQPRREMAAVVEFPSDPDLRVGDADRQHVAELLGDAAAAGYLHLEEFDQRLAAVWSATTSKELSAAQSDLPVQVRRARARRDAAAVARNGLRGHLASYLTVMVLLVTVWLVAGVAGHGWYPWPVWPALGWGIGVVRHLRAAAVPSELS